MVRTVNLKNINEAKRKATWDKVFKSGLGKISGRQPLKNFTWTILEYYDSFDLTKCAFREVSKRYNVF